MSNIRNMKLEVVLAAIDKATKPIKAVMGSSSGLSKQLKETKDKLKELGRQQETLEKFKDTSRGLAVTKHQLQGATEKLAALKQELAQTEYPTKKLTEAIRIQQTETDKLRLRHGKLYAQSVQLQQGLKDYGLETKNLTAQQKRLKAEAEALNPVLDQQKAKLERLNKLQSARIASRARYDKGLENRDRLAGAGATTMAAGTAAGLPIVKMIRDYSSYEDAMLGVARQVEGARDANGKLTRTYYEMGDAIKAMSEQIPMATTEIAGLVEGGARMGIKGKADLLTFAKTAALASTAFDLPPDQISEDLGKIANTYKIPIKRIGELGDVINYLDDNAQAKGADIIDVMQRIAGSTGNMNYKQAAALGSTFLSLGASSEVAASATKAMVRELAIAEKQPARFQAGLKELGLNAKQVQADMARDSTGTILKVMEAVKKLPDAKRMGVVVDLFGKEYGDDAAKLADNLGEYRKQLALVNEAKARGSMGREGDAKNDTLSAQWQMTQNKLFNQSSALGNALRQPLMDVMASVGEVLGKITAWTKANPQLTATLVKIAAGLAVALVAAGSFMLGIAAVLGPIIAFRFAIAMARTQLGSLIPGMETTKKVLGGLHTAWSYAGRGVSWFSKQAGVAFTAFRAALPAVLSAARAFGSGLFQAFFAPIKLLLQGAFFVLKATLQSLPGLLVRVAQAFAVLARFLLMNPIGLAVTVIAGGAYLIWSNWITLGPKFSALWDGIKAGASSLWDGIKNAASSAFTAVSSAAASVWANIQQAFSGGILGVSQLIINWSPLGLFYQAFAGVMNYFGVSMPAKFTDFGRNILQGLVNGITSSMGAVKAAISGAGAATIGWFKEKLGIHSPSRVFAELGGFTMEGLQQGIAGGQGGPLGAVMNVAKKLTAAGAGIAIGATSGLAVAMDTRPPLAASRPAAQLSAPDSVTFNIYQAPGQSPQELARVIEQMMDARDRKKAAAGRGRLTDKD